MASSELELKIVRRIGEEGPVTFEKFMDMALYDADFGYYRSGNIRIGREGDYYTSSCLHPVFGAMLGRQLEEMWEAMGRPRDFEVLEMGSGSGYLCRDILDSLKGSKIFTSLRYCIIEPGKSAKEEQQGVLRDYPEKVKWVSSPGEVNGVKGCLLSNELLDAFPVHLIQMEDGLKEVYVGFSGGRFVEYLDHPRDRAVHDYLAGFAARLERGYRTEVNLRIRDWLKSAAALLAAGFILTIDYGYTAQEYYSEDRNRGTLMCYHRHQLVEDPLVNIGEQDITAHVNFSAVKKWGEAEGIKTLGFCGQGAYLTSLGIDDELKRLAAESKDYPFELARIKKLIMPQGMGESHQVLIQYKGEGRPELKGFKLRNRMRYL